MKLPKLNDVDLTGTNVTQAGADMLKRALPDCRVHFQVVSGPSQDGITIVDGKSKWIPLAPLVQADRDTQDASWNWDGQTAAFSSGKPLAQVSIPLIIGGSYELQTRVTIVQAKEKTTIYLPITETRNAVLHLRGDSGNTASPTATILLEGLNPAPQPQGSASIDIGTEYALTCTVVGSANRVAIEIRRDDQVLFQWAGLVSQIAEEKTMRPGTVQLQTAYYTSSRFTDLRLRMLSGKATPLFPTVSDSDAEKAVGWTACIGWTEGVTIHGLVIPN